MTRQELSDLILKSEAAVKQALVILYKAQEEQEKQARNTIIRNNKGFMPCDAAIMTEMAERVLKGKSLTPAQLELCRKPTIRRGVPRLARYFRQINEVGITINGV